MSKMIKCKTCGMNIAKSAKSCPSCGAKNKKPFYTRWWFVIIAVFVIIGALGSGGTEDSSGVSENATNTRVNSSSESIPVSTDKDESSSAADTSVDNSATNTKTDSVPTEYKSALKKAQIYSESMHMSKAGIYDQLTSEYGEKFPAEAAQYAIDNVKADWNKNALEKAKTYQSMSMSKSAIQDQLTSEYGEKFTEDEAKYAVSNLE